MSIYCASLRFERVELTIDYRRIELSSDSIVGLFRVSHCGDDAAAAGNSSFMPNLDMAKFKVKAQASARCLFCLLSRCEPRCCCNLSKERSACLFALSTLETKIFQPAPSDLHVKLTHRRMAALAGSIRWPSMNQFCVIEWRTSQNVGISMRWLSCRVHAAPSGGLLN